MIAPTDSEYSQPRAAFWLATGLDILQHAGIESPLPITAHSLHTSRIVAEYTDQEAGTYWVKMYPPGEYFDSPAKHGRFVPAMAASGIPTPDLIEQRSARPSGYVCYQGKRGEAGTLDQRLAVRPDQLGAAYRVIGDIARRMRGMPGCAGCGNVYREATDMMVPASFISLFVEAGTSDETAQELWREHLATVLLNYSATGVLYSDELPSFRTMGSLAVASQHHRRDLVMCHGDLHPKNIIVSDADALEVMSVIDLDNISRLPPEAELTKLLGDDIGPRGPAALACFLENFSATYFLGADKDAARQATIDLLYRALFLRMVACMETVNFLIGDGLKTGEKPPCAQILDEISMIMSVANLHRSIYRAEQMLCRPDISSEDRAELTSFVAKYKQEAVSVYVQRRADMVRQILAGRFDPESYEPRTDYPYSRPVRRPLSHAT